MNIKERTAILASKASKKLLRILGRGGTTLPGKIALKICPELLAPLAKDVHCIIITGTNGKTTSARIVEEMIKESGYTYFSNRSGANLITGITTEFINNCSVSGKPTKEYAIIECDEAASKEVCRLIDPDLVLVTNVFRDQLDRYGEVSITLNNILIGLKNSPHAKVCLNADCSLTASLASQIPNEITWFGVDVPIYDDPAEELSDATHCIHCKTKYEYTYHTFGHLGGYYCPNCGYKRPEPQVSVTKVISTTEDGSDVEMNVRGENIDIDINLPGGYNIYNAVGAMAAASTLGISLDVAKCSLAGCRCGFGRMEQFNMGKATARMILVKNPAGCNQVLNYFGTLTQKTILVCALNDRIADGTDISWIWDVDFEKLCAHDDILESVYVTGVRSGDMAVRLKYAGLPEEKLKLFDDYDSLLETISSQELPVVIMPSYTAMMELRAQMSSAFGGGEFWE